MAAEVVDVSPQDVRRAVESQVCPWCQRGPFRVLAKHTWRVHQVTADQLRTIGDLTAKQSLCSVEHAAEARGRLEARPDRDEMIRRARETETHPDNLRLAREAQQSRKKKDPTRHRVVVLYQQRELLGTIAEQVGIHRSTVASVLRERGVTYDPAKLRFHNSEYRDRNGTVIREAQWSWQEVQRQRAADRIEEFRALGGDSAAVNIVAERWGLRRKIVLTFLRRHGEVVRRG